jgi:hypothetical protein
MENVKIMVVWNDSVKFNKSTLLKSVTSQGTVIVNTAPCENIKRLLPSPTLTMEFIIQRIYTHIYDNE